LAPIRHSGSRHYMDSREVDRRHSVGQHSATTNACFCRKAVAIDAPHCITPAIHLDRKHDLIHTFSTINVIMCTFIRHQGHRDVESRQWQTECRLCTPVSHL